MEDKGRPDCGAPFWDLCCFIRYAGFIRRKPGKKIKARAQVQKTSGLNKESASVPPRGRSSGALFFCLEKTTQSRYNFQ